MVVRSKSRKMLSRLPPGLWHRRRVRGFWMCVLLLCNVRCTGGESPIENHPKDNDSYHRGDWLRKTLQSLESATEFFENNFDRIILDGIFGLRIAEGQLLSALQFMDVHSRSPVIRALYHRVAKLKERMHFAAQASIPYLISDNEKYFKVFSDIIMKPYVVSYSPREVNTGVHKKSTTPSRGTSQYHERKGDSCFAELMGQSLSDDRPQPTKCTISDACYRMMTDPDVTDYSLTHQVLFFIQAKKEGCMEALLQVFLSYDGIAEFEQSKCDRIYQEAQSLSRGGAVHPHWQDLFLEQGIVCALMGFENFLRPDWLGLIFNWQSKRGCYTDDDNSYSPKIRQGRRLLYEEELDDGCLSHKSGLGIAILGIYARYILEHDGDFPKHVSFD